MRARALFATLLAAIALAFPSAAPAGAAAPARVDRVSLADLGYRDDVTTRGVYPSFTFNLPRYASLTAATLDLTLHVSPVADPHSTIRLQLNGRPIYEATIAAIGRDPHLRIPLPLPTDPAQNLAITLEGYLFVTGDICADLQSRDLYVTIDHASGVDLTTVGGDRGIAGFFRSYGRQIDVAAPAADRALGIVAVPYRIRQIESWHQPQIVLSTTPSATARTIAIAPAGHGIVRHGEQLSIAADQLDALDPRAFDSFVAPSAGDFNLQTDDGGHLSSRLAFSQLGLHPQTISGIGDLAFEVPLDAGFIGGIPSNLELHLALTHTPLVGSTTGLVKVLVNGTLVAARELNRSATTELYDVAIPPATFAPISVLRIVISYYAGSDSCRGSIPSMTATLLDTSYFSWSSVDNDVGQISDYLKTLGGRVGIFVGDPRFFGAAFHFMDELGKLDPHIRQLSVHHFDGKIPPGYDYAVVFAAPERLDGVGLPIRAAGTHFRIVNPLDGRELFSAVEARGFATIQIGRSGSTQVLAFSYYRDPATIVKLTQLSVPELISQVGNVAFVSDTLVSYDVGDKLRVIYQSEDLPTRIWHLAKLPISVALIAIVLGGVLVASRRLTGSNDP
ncbi:MAG: cellulose biosynthesis cyclic di-GMP-binding regulatory protein BcsB [Vulcanimicrobiaceae bacterium]